MTTLLFLPAASRDYRWISLDASGVTGEGEGMPASDDATVAIVPAEAVTLHWAELPSRSPAQATAAARILAAEASAAPLAELHVTVGDEASVDRPIGVVDAAAMRDWLATLAAAGIDPAAMIPAPMLLPRPDDGYVQAHLAGAQLVRGRSTGFAGDEVITPFVTGGTAPELLDDLVLERSLLAAAARPPLDLRQGAFARRRKVAIDWALIRRLALLGAGILLATLAIDLVRIAKYSFGADALEARADALGRTGLARGETVTDVDRQLSERLAGVRGPGLGFTTTTAAVYAAVRAIPGVELTGLDFQSNGDLRLSVAATRESLPTDLKRQLEAAGFVVTAGTFQSAGGRVTGEMTVKRP